MCENNGIFAGKLHEIEGQYGRILSRLRVAQYESHDEIRRTIRQLEAECRGTESLLEQSIADCRSPAVSALAAAQLDYDQKVRHILHDELPEYLHEEGNDRIADQAEAATCTANMPSILPPSHAACAARRAVGNRPADELRGSSAEID